MGLDLHSWTSVNTLRLRQNGRHFADSTFTCVLLDGNIWISINFSLKFVPKGPINNIPVLVQMMAWRRPGAKPMMASLLTHICVIRAQWVRWWYLSMLSNNLFVMFKSFVNASCVSMCVKLRAVQKVLTHWGQVTHICVSNLTIIGSDNGLSPGGHQPNHYLHQHWNIVNWILGNKLQWNIQWEISSFWKMAAVLSQPLCVLNYVLFRKCYCRHSFVQNLIFAAWYLVHESEDLIYRCHLAHWNRMVAIFLMIFSNPFSWMQMHEFRLKFHWSVFPSV